MGADENIAVHTAWTDAENRHDLSHHQDFLHEDIELFQAGREPIVGLAAFIANLEAVFAGLDGFRVTLDDQFATDDRVVCRWHGGGTHTGGLFGLPATGKELELSGISIWEFDNGKARRGWVIMDVASLMAQL